MLGKIGRVLTGSFFKLAIISLAFSLATLSVLGSPEPIKTSLDESGIYNEVIEGLLESAQKEQDKNTPGEDLSLTTPEIQRAARDAFTPELLKESANNFLDGMQAWLAGDTAEPQFTINLANAKKTFIQRVADNAEARLLSLRPCTAEESAQLTGKDIDPFTVKCRPPILISQEKKKLINELENETEFLEDPVITADNLTKDDANKFQEDLKNLPKSYQLLKNMPVISVVVAVLMAGALVLLHDDKWRGVRKVSMTLLITGLVLLLGTLLIALLFKKVDQNTLVEVDSETLKNSLLDVLQRLVRVFNRTLMVVSIVYTAIGGGGLIGLHFLNKKGKLPEQGSPEEKPTEPTDKPKTQV
jgi:hypothetical protein